MSDNTVKRPKANKRSRLSKLLRKALKLWSKRVKQRDGHVCQLCGARDGELNANGKPVVLNAHHIIGRRCKALRLDLKNGITLCQSCHKFSAVGPHKGALAFCDWLKRERPGLTEYLLSHMEDAEIVSETGLQIVIENLKEELHNAVPQM